MRPPPPLLPPCRCTDAGLTHEEKGLCSAIPPCCRRWFETVWNRTHDDMSPAQRVVMVRLRWGYVPCPGCRQCGAKGAGSELSGVTKGRNMSQKWESLTVIRSVPPAYGVCRAETCRANIEWVTTTGKGAKIPVNLPLSIDRVYERQDGTFVTVIDQGAVHWTTCTESRARVKAARG